MLVVIEFIYDQAGAAAKREDGFVNKHDLHPAPGCDLDFIAKEDFRSREKLADAGFTLDGRDSHDIPTKGCRDTNEFRRRRQSGETRQRSPDTDPAHNRDNTHETNPRNQKTAANLAWLKSAVTDCLIDQLVFLNLPICG